MRLLGKVAIVTGGAGDIGRAVCLGYAREGAKVVIQYHTSAARASEIVGIIASQGGEAISFQADVSEEVQVQALLRATIEKFDRVDVLVNNGAVYPYKDWNEYTVEEWDRVLAVNLRGYWLCAREVFPHMVKQGAGKIINVSSIMAFTGLPGCLPYVASKGAIISFTRALAREVGKYNVNVNTICPGAVQTPHELRDFPEQDKLARALGMLQAFERRELPEDLVGAFVFLASSESDFMTGQSINVDGGWSMR